MASSNPLRIPYILFLILTLFISCTAAWKKWEATNFCVCFGTVYAILPMTTPDTPAQPCLSCTKQWCLNQNLPICAGATLGDTNPDTATGKEGDVEARCFQRDSPRDQLVVTLFLLTRASVEEKRPDQVVGGRLFATALLVQAADNVNSPGFLEGKKKMRR
ncbi:hypothetical protein NLJ89_g3527 [Agrocybe chaxingu]|uniref:Uncharacterized protein n=1 Tax=Agrocybe chaxingu TaxID=84603 RepID=A0A9W8K538_9AGAR|nr:hypothetical protein NLJ89_g3527 [Agrocybe chaxingu]